MTYKDLYELRAAGPSDIHEHLPYFVETCVELVARKVIELGVRTGNSTVGWLYGVEQTDGHVWSVDPDPRALGTIPDDRWTFICGDDTALPVTDQLPDQVDVVFIDTLHYYRHTLLELTLYAPRVRPGGRILLHDTELDRSYFPDTEREHEFPVKQAVTEFCAANGLSWSNRTNSYGIGTIFLPEG